MDKFFQSTFDFFTYVIPGFAILTIAVFFLGSTDFTQLLIESATKLKFGNEALTLVISYMIGFAIYPIGRWMYKSWGTKIWKREIENNHIDLKVTEKYVLIRELSEANFRYVEKWNMFCAMSHNLAVASLLYIIGMLVLIILGGNRGVYFLLLLVGVFAFFVFLHRAVVFANWAANDLNATIEKLNLIEKSKK